MARRGDGIYQRAARWVFFVVPLLWLPSVAEAEFDRTSWLKLYDSPVALAKGAAVAYVYGMANGLTIAEAMDCSGIELSGEELAATVAEFVRNGDLELKVAVPMSLVVHKCRSTPNSVFERARK
jgi:hypothetical protein